MRTVIQRVEKANVTIEDKIYSGINNGLLILLGIEDKDDFDDVEWLCKKIISLRIFDDENGIMNKNIMDINGEILIVSQFTLMASTKKGNRPSYIRASKPNHAIPLYNSFCDTMHKLSNKIIRTGLFGAYMKVSLINDGPVTILIDTKNKE